jgi:protein subunit release factor B
MSTLIDEKDLVESFVRGSGPGGQKINKSKNNVHLVHTPTGISVQCQDARDLTTNRKIARKLLRDKVDLAANGKDSKLGMRHAKITKQKDKAARLVHE